MAMHFPIAILFSSALPDFMLFMIIVSGSLGGKYVLQFADYTHL